MSAAAIETLSLELGQAYLLKLLERAWVSPVHPAALYPAILYPEPF